MTPFTIGLDILISLLSVSMALCFVQLRRGPDVPNRAVAFDLIALNAVGLIALFAMRNGTQILLDLTFVTAVLGFLGTVLIARYLEQSRKQE